MTVVIKSFKQIIKKKKKKEPIIFSSLLTKRSGQCSQLIPDRQWSHPHPSPTNYTLPHPTTHPTSTSTSTTTPITTLLCTPVLTCVGGEWVISACHTSGGSGLGQQGGQTFPRVPLLGSQLLSHHFVVR